MKKYYTLLLLTLGLFLVGCQSKTPQKVAVDTLASIGNSVNTAYEGYLVAVLQGTVRTNEVPQVTSFYRDFQVSFGAAAALAQWSTNTSLANPDLLTAASKVITAITTIKGGK